ncbi:hypothetical protein EDC39_107142 [Geothermobacter ehrlichii]|uniref:VanZ family protein n=1 Tax=Geothermobacter ehrlichii TaxID=213224 RepID=A0A5D3WJA4_9BACT|nr:hypothetical protein [Geothermobacter ehrlichii]TYO98341.1 hypothetical protein EDC39_107142 [Geothermobacter ehrlichii]
MIFLRRFFLSLFWGLLVLTAVLSLLDGVTTEKVYTAAAHALFIDLKAHHIQSVQISDAGHFVAGFVLAGLGLHVVRRWWVLPLVLLFLGGIELAQHFSPERQASWSDLLRGTGGVLVAWTVVTIARRES